MSKLTIPTLLTQGRKRRLLLAATSVVGGMGVIAGAAPFVLSMNPSERAKAASAPVDVGLSKLEAGQQITVSWRGKPVWILRRTAAMLETLHSESFQKRLLDPDSSVLGQQPEYARNRHRSAVDEYFIIIGICTHLGCVPSYRPDIAPNDLGPAWSGGYFCPCHGSRFDLAGRVYASVPAPTNLVVPPYRFLNASKVRIGEHPLLIPETS